MLLDWLLKTEEGNISYEELTMFAQDRSIWSQSCVCQNLPYGRTLHTHVKVKVKVWALAIAPLV